MTFTSWTDNSPRNGAPRGAPAGRVRPQYTPRDVPVLLWRERWLMLAVFLVIVVGGVLFALSLKTDYASYSSLLVRLGEEYVYQPQVGDAARGTVPENDQVIQSEVEILSSDQLKAEVIEHIGLRTLFPKLADTVDHAPRERQAAARQTAISSAVAAMAKRLKVDTAPGTPVIRLTYSADDPQLSALTLNTLVDQYLVYRRSILVDRSQPLDDQRRAFEARLAQADAAYENFLGSNNIGDFETEKASLAQLQASLQQQKYAADSQLSDRQGRLAALTAQAQQLAPEVGLYRDVDHTAQDKLSTLKLQREDLLSRYRPDAAPVRDLDAQIATLQAGIGQGGLQGDGARRMGINPVYQTVESDRIQLTAEVAALTQSSQALSHQIDEVTDRQLRLAQLQPQYEGLTRDRDLLQNSVRDYTVKTEETEAAAAIARQGDDNISIVERATPAVLGKSLKHPVMVLAVLLAGFTALCAGLVRVFLRPGLPTAASAGRTLDLPVLATAGVKS